MSKQKTCLGVAETTIVVSGGKTLAFWFFLQQNFIELLPSVIPCNTTARIDSELTVSDLLFYIQENTYFLGNGTTE